MGRMVLMADTQMERRGVGDYCNDHHLGRGLLMESTPPVKSVSNASSPVVLRPDSLSSGGGRSSVGGGGGLGYFEHIVSKFDTLVGVAIKYGVEVADIKRMNGLTTDQKMFALKSLRIPLQGRHPPSPIMSNGSTKHMVTRDSDKHSDLFNSIKSLKLSSPCQLDNSAYMNNLQIYYGCNPNDENGVEESFQTTFYRKGSIHCFKNEQETSQTPNLFVDVHRKSKVVVDVVLEKCDMLVTNAKNDGFDKYFDKLVRRRNGKNTIH